MYRAFKWVMILVLIAGLGAVAAAPAVQWWQKGQQPTYTTAEVTRGRVETVVNSTGTVKAVRTVTVGAFVSGPITAIRADFNDRVTSEQLLAEIDPRLFKAALARDQAALARDQATLKTQRAELRRVEALLKQAVNNEGRARRLLKINKDYLSETEWDQLEANRKSFEAQKALAEASIEQAKAAVEQAKANLKNSEANLEYTNVKAPKLKAGETAVVIERKVDSGQTVASQFQTPEMFILAINLDQEVHVYATVDEADIGLITRAEKSKRPVRFSVDAYPHDLFTASKFHVRKNSTTTQNVVTYPVVVEAKNPDMKLFPGMTASLSFLIEGKDEVLRVPTTALRFVPQPKQVRPEDRHYIEGGPAPDAAKDSGVRLSAKEKTELAKSRLKRIVWVQDGELLRAVPVTLGLMDNQWAELLEGALSERQALVTGVEAPVNGRR
jgi:HlyD family secretion protein